MSTCTPEHVVRVDNDRATTHVFQAEVGDGRIVVHMASHQIGNGGDGNLDKACTEKITQELSQQHAQTGYHGNSFPQNGTHGNLFPRNKTLQEREQIKVGVSYHNTFISDMTTQGGRPLQGGTAYSIICKCHEKA